jgi:hypothetical protein
MLQPLGEVKKQQHRKASMIGTEKPGFDHSPVQYVHKFTDNTEYNSLKDPLLESHFLGNSGVQKNLIAQALITPDLFVLHTEKKAHFRKHMGALKNPASVEGDRLALQRAAAKAEQQKSFKELCEAKLNNWRQMQVAESKMVEAIKGKVDANRVGVADAPLTEQTRIYVEDKKAEFEDHADHAELRRFELESERKVKHAIKEKRLRAERASKKAALEEAIEIQEADLSAVKANIVETKATQAATMVRIKVDTLARQHKATSEAQEFERHMTKVFEERTEKQEQDIITRKEKAAAENKSRREKRDADLAEKEALRNRQKAIEDAARNKKLAEMAEEDRLRKVQQMEEKEARKEAKRLFLVEQQRKAALNKVEAEEERVRAKAASEAFTAEQEAIREGRRQRNAAEKTKRLESIAKAQAEDAALKKFEADNAKKMQAEELAAAEHAFKIEQERLWQQALDEEMLHERQRQAQAKAKREAAEKVKQELLREQAAKEAMEVKAAAAKIEKEKAKKIKLQNAKEEMNRRIAYMEKFGV